MSVAYDYWAEVVFDIGIFTIDRIEGRRVETLRTLLDDDCDSCEIC